MRSGTAWFAGALLIAGCGGSSGPAKPRPQPAPATQLADLAGRGANASYAATYDFIDPAKSEPAKVSVWHRRDSLRVDISVGTTRASIISAPDGTWSCATRGGRRSCLTIAKPGQPVPAAFAIAPVTLFSTYLRVLAAPTDAYDVHRASAPPDVPATASCFAVRPKTSGATVASGTYCFSADGVLQSARFPSRNSVQRTSLQPGEPPAAEFTPYATPSPFPS